MSKRPQATRLERVGAFVLGILLLLLFYYDPLPKNLYHGYVMGKVAGLGLILTVGMLWMIFRNRNSK
jgi:hypothetical protein